MNTIELAAFLSISPWPNQYFMTIPGSKAGVYESKWVPEQHFQPGRPKNTRFFTWLRAFEGSKIDSVLAAFGRPWTPKARPRAPKSRPRRPRSGPGAAPQAPKSHPRAPRSHPRAAQERPRAPKSRPRAPKSAQDGPGAAQKESQEPPGGTNSSETTGPRHCRKRCSKILVKRSFETATRKINETP